MSRLALINVAAAAVVAVASLIGGAHGHGHGLVQRQDPDAQIPPTLFFDTIQNLTTCTTGIEFTWFYIGAYEPMALTVTNLGVPQQPASSAASPVNKTLSTDIIPQASTFVWGRVDVPPGNYRLAATFPTLGFEEQSAVFHVVRGRDTSCLPEPLPEPSSSGSTSQSQSTNTPPPPSSSSPRPSDAVLPVAGVMQRVSTGTIVGIVLGVAAMLILAVATYFFLYRKKQKGWRPQGGAKMASRKWNGLNSADSRRGLADAFSPSAPPLPSSPIRSRRLSSGQRRDDQGQHSTGGVVVSSADEVGGATESEEKFAGGRYSRKNSAATTYEEHDNAMVLANLPTLHHQHGHAPPSARARVNSRRSSYSEPLGAAVADRGTRQDVEGQYHPYTQPHSVSRSASTTTSAATHQTGVMTSPDPKKAHRNSIGGRKRKPPPVYDPNEDAALPATGVSIPEISPFQTPPSTSSPFQTALMDPESSADLHSHQSHQSGVGHYATRHVTVASSQPEDGEGLVHKSSFGQGGVNDSKPVHYLIPDMPTGSTRKR